MNWFTAAILFVLIWWTVLFAVLPLGQKPRSEPDPVSGYRGLPEAPRIGRVVLITTAVSLLLWAGCELLITSNWLSFRHGALSFQAE